MKKRLAKNDDESDQKKHLSTKQSETERIECITEECGSTAQQRNNYQKPAEELKIDVERLSIEPTTPSQKSPVTVQEWINSLNFGSEEGNRCESEAQDVEEELPTSPPFEADEKNIPTNPNLFREHLPEGLCDDNLYLGAEARNLDGILQDAAFNRFANSLLPHSRRVTLGDAQNKQSSFNSDFSSFSGVSSFSSVESLLEARKEDPEELLLALGFGGQTGNASVSRIPKRFFMEPSHARGVNVDSFLQHHENALNKNDIGSWGFLGPSVSSYSQLSRRLSNIATANTVLGKFGGGDRHRKISSQSAMCWSDVKQTLRAATAFREGKLRHSSDSILDPANREFLQKQGIDEPLNKPKKVVIGLHTYCFSHEGDLIQGAYGTTGAETPFSSNIVKWKEKQMSALDEADEDNIRSLPEKDKKNLNETLEACTSTTDAFETSWKSQDESLIVSRNNDKKLRTTKSSSFPVLGSRHRLLSRQSNIEEDESEDGKITDRIQLVRPHSSPGEEKKAVLLLSAEIVSLNGTNEPSKKPLVAQESDLSTNYVRRPESLKVDNIQNKESFELEELSTTEGENSYVIECSQQHLNVDGLSGGSCPSDSSGFAEDVPSCGSARINIDNSLEEGFGKSQKEECEEMEDESGKYCSHHLTEQVKNQSGLNLDQATSHASSGLENPDLSIGLQSNQEFVVLYQQSCADVTTQVTYSQSNPISVKCVPSLLPKSHTDITANVDISTEHCASSITESVKLQMENLTPVKLFYPYLTSTSSHSSRDFKLGTVKLNDVSDVSCQTSELGVFETSVNVGNCSSSFSSKDFKFGSVKLTDVSDVACQTSELGNFDTSLNVGTVNQLFQEPSNRELRNVQQEILHTLSMKQTLLELQNLQLALKHYRFAEQQQLASRTYKFQRLLSNMSGDQRACYQLLQDIRQDIIEEVILMEELLLSLLSALCDVETASEFQNWDNRHLSEAVNKMADLLRFQTSLQSQLERIVLIMNPSQTEHPKSVINLTSVGIISQKPDCGELGWRVETIDQPESIEHVLNKESEDVVLEQPDQSELRWRAETTDQPESIEHVLKKESEDDVCQKSKPGELGWRMETTKQWESIKLVCNKESENVVSQQPDQSELGWRVETTNQPESKEHVLNKKSEDDICQKSQQGEIGHSMETPNQPRSTECVLNREVEDACKQPDQSELDWRAGTIDQPELIEHVLNKESECTFFKQPNMVYLDKSREKISPSKCTLDTETGSSVYQQTDPAATAQEDQLEHVFTLAEVEEEMSIEKSTHYSSTKYILNHVFSSDVTLQNVNSGMEGNDCQQQQSNSSLNSVYGNVVVEQPRVENIFQICTSDCFNNVTHGINCDEQQEFEQNKQEINSGAQFKIK